MKPILTAAMLLICTYAIHAQTTTITFEDKSLPPNSYENGANLSGGFTSGGAFFNNNYNSTFDFWLGWSYSNVKDVTTPGFTNQYAAYHLPSGGGDASSNFGVAFNFDVGDARVTLPSGTNPLSMRLTNVTYTALSMRDGDAFAKKFGGATGNDPDFFLLNIQGRDASNAITGTVPFYLADFRFNNNALDYIISNWTTVDLSSLPANTTALTFELTSSDNGAFGMNTPAYFAMDTLILAVPEPGSFALISLMGTSTVGIVWGCRRRFSRKH